MHRPSIPWSDSEKAILANNRELSVIELARLLPGRTPRAVRRRECSLGIHRRTPEKVLAGDLMRRPSSPSIDSAIQRVLESREGRRGIVELGKRISRSPTWIYKRARMLGLSQVEIARHWSGREEAIIRNSATLSDGAIQALLYKAGFCRSTMAIRIKLEKLRADRTNMDIMPTADVADFLGLARSSVDHWLEKGIIKGTKKSALGNWSVRRNDLRDFIVQNPIRINLKKVRDTEWFIDLLATRPKKKHRGESEDLEP